MDLGAALRYPFKDPKWFQKLLVGGLIGIIPVVGQMALLGWHLEVIQRVGNDYEIELPEWAHFGDYLVKGLVAAVGYVAYFAPVWVLFLCIQIPLSGLVGAGGAREDGGVLAGLAGLAGLCIVGLELILGLAATFVLWIATIRYAASEEISSFVDISTNIALLRDHWAALAGSYLVLLVATIALYIGMFLIFWTVCGLFLLLGYFAAFFGHVQAGVARKLDIVYQPGAADFWA